MNVYILLLLVLVVLLVIAILVGLVAFRIASRGDKSKQILSRIEQPQASPDPPLDIHSLADSHMPASPSVPPVTSVPTSPPFVAKPSSRPDLEKLDQPVMKAPDLNPINVLVRAIQSDLVKIPATPSKSIAEQIDEILQEKLLDSPLAERAIRLMEMPDKSIAVMIGLTKYAGLEAVPEEEIRSLIRSSVAEWERRTAG